MNLQQNLWCCRVRVSGRDKAERARVHLMSATTGGHMSSMEIFKMSLVNTLTYQRFIQIHVFLFAASQSTALLAIC